MSDGQGGAAGAGASGGEGGGAGGAATADDLIGGGAGGAAGGAAGAAGAGGDAGAGAGDGAGAGGDAGAGGGADNQAAYNDWLGQFSADAGEGDTPSLRDWIQSSGVKDLAGLAQIARDNQRALRESGRIKVPGEGAKPEEISAFNKAIGVPDDAKGYKMPELKGEDGQPLLGEDGKPIQFNNDRLQAIAAWAHEAGMPAKPLEAVLQKVAEADLQDAAEAEREIQRRAAAHAEKWGAEKAENTAAINRAMQALGLTRDEGLAIRAAISPERALDIFAKLGRGIGEDTLVNGGGKQTFGLSGAEAKTRLTERQANKEWVSKAMVPGTAENAEYERLNNAIAADADRQAQAA